MSSVPEAVESYVRIDLQSLLPENDLLNWAANAQGEIAREVAGRRTLKLQLGGRDFYLKLHQGVGWPEIFKNWLIMKAPVLGAENEYLACKHLETAGIAAPRVAAYARSGGSGARQWSFVLCDALVDFEDLETLSLGWREEPPSGRELRRLVMQVADFARRFHEAGVVHRDFYICHLLRSRSQPDADLAVLDLHRALLFADGLPQRWRRRDLAALLYSVLALPLERRAWLRFVRVYTGRPLRETFAEQPEFWASIYRRALRLQAKGERKGLNPSAIAHGSTEESPS